MGLDLKTLAVSKNISKAMMSDNNNSSPQPDWNETDSASNAFIKNKPQQLPASDVYNWAKAESKPAYTKDEIGLELVDNTSDMNKPVSTKQQAALDNYYKQSTGYTDQKIADLIGGAPETLDTLKEVADALEENKDVVDALNAAIGKKANQTELDTHTANGTIHVTASERNNWNSKLDSNGNAVSATKAIQDGNGNVIANTYELKQGMMLNYIGEEGWYRIARYVQPDGNESTVRGADAHGCEIILKRAFGNNSTEYHHMELLDAYNSPAFKSVAHRCRVQLMTGIRLTVDTSAKAAYIEVYYKESKGNATYVNILGADTAYCRWEIMRVPVKVAETPSSSTVEVLATASLPSLSFGQATCDGDGNVIPDTYAKKDDIKELKQLITMTLRALNISGNFENAGKAIVKWSDFNNANIYVSYIPRSVAEEAIAAGKKVIVFFTDGAIGKCEFKNISMLKGSTIEWMDGSVPYVSTDLVLNGTKTLAVTPNDNAYTAPSHGTLLEMSNQDNLSTKYIIV